MHYQLYSITAHTPNNSIVVIRQGVGIEQLVVNELVTVHQG